MRGAAFLLVIFPTFLSEARPPARAARPHLLVRKPPVEHDVHALAGINFPPRQGNTHAGSFCEGVYDWGYRNAEIAAANGPFDAMRLPINEDTANDPKALEKMKHYVDQFAGKHAIIAMVDTAPKASRDERGRRTVKYADCDHNDKQGDGKPDPGVAAAWRKIHAVFKDYRNVRYEIFNEPHGYKDAGESPKRYVEAMEKIIREAKLPRHRCILDGTGYADNIQDVAPHWDGELALHVYPGFAGKDRSQSSYSNAVQNAIGKLGKRTWITEFGANLGGHDRCYDRYVHAAEKPGDIRDDINMLRGLDDALRALRGRGDGIKGAFFWHGRGGKHSDSYDFWAGANAQGACKVKEILTHD